MRPGKFMLCTLVLTMGCVSSSLSREGPTSLALPPPATAPLVRLLYEAAPPHSELSGFAPLIDGSDAYYARVALAQEARRSLDIQYYIWEKDKTGLALLSYVLDAAERGVRVRLLIDDIHAGANREFFGALDRHPNIEIRLFNPAPSDSQGLSKVSRGLELAFGYSEMNKRMHNKAFIADGLFGIVGGRNVADAYFDLDKDRSFRDFDMLAAGPVVGQLEMAFDEYWNSSRSFALARRSEDESEVEGADWEALRQKYEIARTSEDQELFEERHAPRPHEIAHFVKTLRWAPAVAVYDSPESVADESGKVIARELQKWPEPQASFIAESAYFIPPRGLLVKLKAYADRGVKVEILTNSLRSNDVLLAHAGYAAKRKAVLATGAELHEWRNAYSKDKTATGIYASRASLHTKSFVIDHRYTFVGSMNLDPRSIRLNTEGGLMIESAEIAAMVENFIHGGMDENASWRVTLDCPQRFASGSCETRDKILHWRGKEGDREITLNSEPETAGWKDVLVRMIGRLPIEDSL